jgi:hypothetical protein
MMGTASDSRLFLMTGNVAEHNGLGFYALRPGNMLSNTAANNSQAGFQVVANTAAFQGNTAVGNAGRPVSPSPRIDAGRGRIDAEHCSRRL